MKSIWLYERHTLLFSVSLSLSTSGKLFLSTAVRLSMDAPSFRVSWNHSLSSVSPTPFPARRWPWPSGALSALLVFLCDPITTFGPAVLLWVGLQLCLTLAFCWQFSEQSGPFLHVSCPLNVPSLGKRFLIASSAHQAGCILWSRFDFFINDTTLWIYTTDNLLAHSWSSSPIQEGGSVSCFISPSPRTFADTQWLCV